MNEHIFEKYRKKAGKNRTQIAKEVGIDKSTLTNYIKGRRKPPVHVGLAIANTIGYKMDQEGLFNEEDHEKRAEASNQP